MKKLIVMIVALTLVFAFASCQPAACTHVDADKNLVCDECGEKLPCTDHVDENGDLVCDKCEEKLPCTDHVDANFDGVCDTEGCDEAVAVDVMTYAEYVAAEVDTQVIIEAHVQGKQSWWDNKATVYLQDKDGGYLAYNMTCSEADYAKLTVGTKIRVIGYKAEWSGEVEIVDAYFHILEGETYVAEPVDLSGMLDSDSLIDYQNVLASYGVLNVVSIEYKNGGGDDIYLTLAKGENEYSFCVERYLTAPDSEVYTTVCALTEGDAVYVEGFLYWYEGMNPHITAVKKIASHEEYVAAENDDEVVIVSYVQAMQSWWDNKATIYLQSPDGAYFSYETACSEETYNSIVPGTKVLIVGYKGEWAGEVEIMDGTLTVINDGDTYVAEAQDLTALLGTDELINHQNELALLVDMTVVKIEYKNGTPGDDIYLTLSKDDVEYSLCVEKYLTGPDTELYKLFTQGTVLVGDVVDVECFVYWYNGFNGHVVAIENINA